MLKENSSNLLLPSKTSDRTYGHIRDPVQENGFELSIFSPGSGVEVRSQRSRFARYEGIGFGHCSWKWPRIEAAPPVITDAYNWARNDYGGLAERAWPTC